MRPIPSDIPSDISPDISTRLLPKIVSHSPSHIPSHIRSHIPSHTPPHAPNVTDTGQPSTLRAIPFAAPHAVARGRFPGLRSSSRWLAAGQWAVTLALVAFLIVPMLMSMLAGLTVNYFRGLSSGLTLRWVTQVWQSYHDSVYASLGVALATLAITIVLGVPAAYALARSRHHAARWIEELLVLPVALPGFASALALIVVYGGFGGFRRSFAFIVVGHVVFTLPFMVRAVAAVCASIDLRTLEEGAASLGAGFARRFFTIVLPNVRSGIAAGAVAVLTLSLGEFNLTWMLHTPDTKTLPVGLADTYASMRIEIASAYTLIFLAMALPLLIAVQRLAAPVRPVSKDIPQ